jgi:hypothetical protein
MTFVPGDWSDANAVGQLDIATHTGFLLAEDMAMKTYLEGLEVPEKDHTIDVGVWFRYPEGERRIKYPFITIDFLAVDPDPTRWTSQWHVPEDYCLYLDPITGEPTGKRGMYIPSTAAELPPKDDDTFGYHIDSPLMHTITYQIAVHCRSAIHDRYLTSRFMVDVLPPRPFYIPVDADMTYRRCDLLDMAQADTHETTESGSKRIFRKIYTVAIDAEIPISKIYALKKAQRIHVDIYADTPLREPADHPYNAPHEIAEPVTVLPEVEQ